MKIRVPYSARDADRQEPSGQALSRRAQVGADREAELELAYATSASQDIAMAQEAQAVDGDGLVSEDWS